MFRHVCSAEGVGVGVGEVGGGFVVVAGGAFVVVVGGVGVVAGGVGVVGDGVVVNVGWTGGSLGGNRSRVASITAWISEMVDCAEGFKASYLGSSNFIYRNSKGIIHW